jgi:hypothetical protein
VDADGPGESIPGLKTQVGQVFFVWEPINFSIGIFLTDPLIRADMGKALNVGLVIVIKTCDDLIQNRGINNCNQR